MSFNPNYIPDFNDKQAAEATADRDRIMNKIAAAARDGVDPKSRAAMELVDEYRFGFIDKWMYKSTPIIFFGLSAVVEDNRPDKLAYDAYGEGTALWLKTAFRAYYYYAKGQPIPDDF